LESGAKSILWALDDIFNEFGVNDTFLRAKSVAKIKGSKLGKHRGFGTRQKGSIPRIEK